MSGAVEGVESENERLRSAIQALRGTLQCIANEQGDTVLGRRCLAAIGKSRVPRASLTTPPARSYADGVEDAAKVAEASISGSVLLQEAVLVIRIVAAIRLLLQGERA